jgi:hypothetical protein
MVEERELQYASLSMNRRFVAAAWIAGATVPLLMSTLFLVGCCALPFHGVMHKLMPICDMAAQMIRGGHAETGHEADAVPPPPSREKQETGKRSATTLPQSFRAVASGEAQSLLTPSATDSYRSFISLGAARCDRDVGLHVWVETFRI